MRRALALHLNTGLGKKMLKSTAVLPQISKRFVIEKFPGHDKALILF
jgi:hypothetical protein